MLSHICVVGSNVFVGQSLFVPSHVSAMSQIPFCALHSVLSF